MAILIREAIDEDVGRRNYLTEGSISSDKRSFALQIVLTSMTKKSTAQKEKKNKWVD